MEVVRFFLGLISFLLPLAHGAKIIMWMSFGSKSHFITWKPLALSLARKGHQLTVVAPMEDKGKETQVQNLKWWRQICEIFLL